MGNFSVTSHISRSVHRVSLSNGRLMIGKNRNTNCKWNTGISPEELRAFQRRYVVSIFYVIIRGISSFVDYPRKTSRRSSTLSPTCRPCFLGSYTWLKSNWGHHSPTTFIKGFKRMGKETPKLDGRLLGRKPKSRRTKGSIRWERK